MLYHGWQFPGALDSSLLDDGNLHIELELSVLEEDYTAVPPLSKEFDAFEYATIESRLLRGWMLDHFIPDAAVDALLRILKTTAFNCKNIPNSAAKLKSCDSVFLPPVVCKQLQRPL